MRRPLAITLYLTLGCAGRATTPAESPRTAPSTRVTEDPVAQSAPDPADEGAATQETFVPSRDLAWLVGYWLAEEGDRREVEHWKADGDALRGRNESWRGGELVHHERLQIVKHGETVVYRADPATQAGHEFPLVEHAEGVVRFEDPAHDWPQRIVYTRQGDELTATVSGGEGNKSRTAVWTWRLAPEPRAAQMQRGSKPSQQLPKLMQLASHWQSASSTNSPTSPGHAESSASKPSQQLPKSTQSASH